MSDDLSYRWRYPVTDAALFDLTESHGGRPQHGWWDRVSRHSLGWVSAHLPDDTLVGFVNLAWDGGVHAFLLDTKVRPDHQRRGIATQLVARATHAARDVGCEWLHVDFEEHLRPFYVDACGFRPTDAGLIPLQAG
jgi:GNAT superfamily N-acetyltransferase